MTEEIRRTLDDVLPQALPPAPWEPADLELVARRRTRNRWIGVAGAGLAVVAVVALVVPLAWSGFQQATPPGEEMVEQPEFPLPKLDDDEHYRWSHSDGKPTHTAATEEISDRFWSHMEKNYEDLELFRHKDYKNSVPMGEVDPVSLVRVENQLWTEPDAEFDPDKTYDKDDYPNPEFVHEQPLYTFVPTLEDYAGFRFGGTGHADRLSVEVHPKGGFVEGMPKDPWPGRFQPHPQYLVERCDSHQWTDLDDETVTTDVTCTESEDEQGRAVVVERTDDTGTTSMTQRSVVLYRTDGTAVVITDEPYEPNFESVTATLTGEQLLAMARAIPSVVVQ